MPTDKWPQVGICPLNTTEHAAQIKHDALELKAYLNRDKTKKPNVPYTVAMKLLNSCSEFAEKVLSQPQLGDLVADITGACRDMATTRDHVSTMKNEIHTFFQKGAKSSAESSATSGFRRTRGWAADAAAAPYPPSQASPPSTLFQLPSTVGSASNTSPNAQQTTTIKTLDTTTQEDRSFIVKINDPKHADTLRRSHVELLKRVNDALSKSGRQEINKLKMLAAKQLKSGDVKITARTIGDAGMALSCASHWVKALGAKATPVIPTYGVIVHGIPVKSMQLHSEELQEEMAKIIVADNASTIPEMEITHIGWLSRKAEYKPCSSVVIEFTYAATANLTILKSLIWKGEVYGVERYDRSCRMKQCFRCHKYGHVGPQCLAETEKCGRCAQNHSSKDCPDPKNIKCAACGGKHDAKDPICPERKKELERVREAKANSPRFWPVPANQAVRITTSAPTPAPSSSPAPPPPPPSATGTQTQMPTISAEVAAANPTPAEAARAAAEWTTVTHRKPAKAKSKSRGRSQTRKGNAAPREPSPLPFTGPAPRVSTTPILPPPKGVNYTEALGQPPQGNKKSAPKNKKGGPAQEVISGPSNIPTLSSENFQTPMPTTTRTKSTGMVPINLASILPPAFDKSELKKRAQSRSPEKEGRNIPMTVVRAGMQVRVSAPGPRTVLGELSLNSSLKRQKLDPKTGANQGRVKALDMMSVASSSSEGSRKSLRAIKAQAAIDACQEEDDYDELSTDPSNQEDELPKSTSPSETEDIQNENSSDTS